MARLAFMVPPSRRGPSGPGSVPLEFTTLTAKNGRLVTAWLAGCTFERTFFDDMPPGGHEELSRRVRRSNEERFGP